MAVPRARVVLVAVLALTAGCAGFLGDRPTRRAVTPMPVPTTAPSPAPGVPAPTAAERAGRAIDVATLLAADRRVRSQSAYRFERTATIAGPNGSVRFDRVRRIGPRGHVREDLRTEASGETTPVFDSAQLWSNGSVAWSRTRFADGRVFLTRSIHDTVGPFGLGLDLPATVLDATAVEVRGRTDDGAVLASDRPFALSERLVPVATDGPRNATARMVVSERGVVRSLRLDYETRTGSGPVSVTIRQRVTAVNETTVTRPEWVDRVRSDGRRTGRGQ